MNPKPLPELIAADWAQALAPVADQIAAIFCSNSLSGATYTCCIWLTSGSGKPLRSSLPLGVSGIRSRNIKCVGTM